MEVNLCASIYRVIFALSSISLVYAEYCIEYGHSCREPNQCCGHACCLPAEPEDHYRNHLRWSVWNMWYFWFVVLFVLMSCFGGCSYYRRHQLLIARQQGMMGGATDDQYPGWRFSPSFPVSLFSGYHGYGARSQQHQRIAQVVRTEPSPHVAAATFPSPPAYSEVMSQPEVYPVNKGIELPPYPSTGTPGFYSTSVPTYTEPVVQLPPYTAAASVHSNQATATSPHNKPCTETSLHSNPYAETSLHSNQSSSHTTTTAAAADDIHGNSEAPAGERTSCDCTTQTVSGIES